MPRPARRPSSASSPATPPSFVPAPWRPPFEFRRSSGTSPPSLPPTTRSCTRDRPAMPVHVSIHDVSPAWTEEVESAIALCASAGVRPALLVVPNFHGRAPLLDDAPFCARLRELQAAGHEIYLHGFFHRSGAEYDAAAGTGSRLAWLFAQRVASGGEAEMSDVSEGEGRRRIEE